MACYDILHGALVGFDSTDDVRLDRLRISKLNRLLLESDESFKELSGKVGIGTAANMFPMFKRHAGMTPKEYLEKTRIKDRRRRERTMNDGLPLSAIDYHQKQHRLISAGVDDGMRDVRSIGGRIPLAEGFAGIT